MKMRPIAEINASHPQADRVFGEALCAHFGLDPDSVHSLVVSSDSANPYCLQIEFYKFKRQPGWWGYEDGPIIRGPDGPELELITMKFVGRYEVPGAS